MMVVAILAILAMIVVPIFAPYDDEQKLILAADEFGGALRFAREEARRLGSDIKVTVNTVNENFQVIDVATGNLIFHPVRKQLYSRTFDSTSLESGVDIVNAAGLTGIVTITFLSTGRPSILADVVIRLAYGVHNRTVTLQEETGRVAIQ